MTLVRSLCLGLVISATTVGYAFAQAASTLPAAPAKSCEQNLEETQNALLETTKAKAQAEFRAAAIEQAAVSLKKQLEAEQAKTKTPEKK